MTALKIGMRILWGEGGVLPSVGVSEWVVSGNEYLNRGRGICGFLFRYVCMSGLFDGVKVCAKLSIQVNATLESNVF